MKRSLAGPSQARGGDPKPANNKSRIPGTQPGHGERDLLVVIIRSTYLNVHVLANTPIPKPTPLFLHLCLYLYQDQHPLLYIHLHHIHVRIHTRMHLYLAV